MTKPGTRVIALQTVKDGIVYSFGAGVYEGDFPRPGTKDMPEGMDLEILTRQIEKDKSPAGREDWLKFITSLESRAVEEGLRTQEESEKFLVERMAEYNEKIARPTDMQIKELWISMQKNPRILLDNDRGYVWGFESWWGPEENVLAKYPDLTWTEVTPQYNTAS